MLFCADYDQLEQVAEVILENGITEPNFRYTGARLCDNLSLHLTVISDSVILDRDIFLNLGRVQVTVGLLSVHC